jgi:lipid-A-disaccharide synthase
MPSSSILLSAGEASGDLYAAKLAEALRRRGVTEIFGLGGAHMRAAGVELVADAAPVSVTGITEVVRHLPALRRTFARVVDQARRRGPRLAVLTDFPGFHLRLARRLAAQGIPCVYFVAPQFWAWRSGRARLVRRHFRRALCIFPFEEPFYRRYGVRADFIGHPLVDIVRPSMPREEFLRRQGLDPARPVIALLPGSRRNELEKHLPPVLGGSKLIARQVPEAQFVLALAPAMAGTAPVWREVGLPEIRMIAGATYDVVASAQVAVVASGTATIETALLGTPMSVIYRMAPLTAAIVRRMVHTPYFAMPNLVAGRKVVSELFQDDCRPERIASEVLRLLGSNHARSEMKTALAEVRTRLGSGGAIERAAEIILDNGY